MESRVRFLAIRAWQFVRRGSRSDAVVQALASSSSSNALQR